MAAAAGVSWRLSSAGWRQWSGTRRRLLLPSCAVRIQPCRARQLSGGRWRLLRSCCSVGYSTGTGPTAGDTTSSIADHLKAVAALQTAQSGPLAAGLYLVATPIGNLEDITLRALRILREADAVLAEDTRHTVKLLNHYAISTRLISCNEHNERQKSSAFVERLQQGQALALVSDAGMPGVSDPGAVLVQHCIEEGVRVFSVPGPSAVLSALVASGLSTREFMFGGFLPAPAAARRQTLSRFATVEQTVAFYVPPHRLQATLQNAAEAFRPDRKCVVARELTKLHEEFWRGTLGDAKAHFDEHAPRGEITLLIAGYEHAVEPVSDAELAQRLRALFDGGVSASEATRQVAEETGIKRNRVYAITIDMVRSEER
eukprot:jgi/Chlat1/6511/Chrsp45S05993